jgi:putative SOS response-associated peptidase YedK
MCGRFVIAGNKAAMLDAFNVDESFEDEMNPSWNVAPMTGIPFVSERLSDGTLTRRLDIARWGLVPVWAKDPKIGSRMINARAESVLDKPSFRTAAAKRRALVPANGYYEWQKNPDGTKTPTYLHPEREDDLIAFAALYEFWPDPEKADGDPEKWLTTATILTTDATDSLGHIHDRSPLIVPKDLHADWLDPAVTAKKDVLELIEAIPEPVLVPRVVGKDVGSVRNDGPHLIEPAE